MNNDQVKGKWKQLRGSIKEKWGKLTDDEVDQAEGNLEKLGGALQERYGYTKEQAKKQINELQSSF